MAAPTSGALKRRAQLILPSLYLAFAVYAWIDFVNTNHDGLANIGLFLVTLPVALAELLVGAIIGQRDVFMPDGYGYLGNHVLYYAPAVAVTATIWWWIGRAIDRILAR